MGAKGASGPVLIAWGAEAAASLRPRAMALAEPREPMFMQ